MQMDRKSPLMKKIFALCPRHTWTVSKLAARSKTLYARTTIGGRALLLHRMIMNAVPGEEIDHIDGNGLNNCKGNLRRIMHFTNPKRGERSGTGLRLSAIGFSLA
jgi:hypothetical protein